MSSAISNFPLAFSWIRLAIRAQWEPIIEVALRLVYRTRTDQVHQRNLQVTLVRNDELKNRKTYGSLSQYVMFCYRDFCFQRSSWVAIGGREGPEVFGREQKFDASFECSVRGTSDWSSSLHLQMNPCLFEEYRHWMHNIRGWSCNDFFAA